MKSCGKCGRESGRIQPREFFEVRKELVGGMDVVLVNAVSQLVCESCGTVIRNDIPDMPGLIAAVCVARAKESLKLNKDEIRFLRKSMEKSAKELAQELRVTDETVSRWENGHLVMGESVERIFRWRVCKALEDRAPAIQWNDDEILTKMNITPVSVQPLVMAFQRAALKRKEQWQESERKAA